MSLHTCAGQRELCGVLENLHGVMARAFLPTVSLLAVALIKSMTRSNLGRKSLFHLTVVVHPEGKSEQELEQKPWRSAAFCLAPWACSVCFL